MVRSIAELSGSRHSSQVRRILANPTSMSEVTRNGSTRLKSIQDRILKQAQTEFARPAQSESDLSNLSLYWLAWGRADVEWIIYEVGLWTLSCWMT